MPLSGGAISADPPWVEFCYKPIPLAGNMGFSDPNPIEVHRLSTVLTRVGAIFDGLGWGSRAHRSSPAGDGVEEL